MTQKHKLTKCLSPPNHRNLKPQNLLSLWYFNRCYNIITIVQFIVYNKIFLHDSVLLQKWHWLYKATQDAKMLIASQKPALNRDSIPFLVSALVYQDTRSCVSSQERHVTHNCGIYRICCCG